MSDKTPKRAGNPSSAGFSPVALQESPAAASPQKSLTGLPRVVRDLVADLYNGIQRWNDLHVKGAVLVKEIASMKSENPKDFSDKVEQPINSLFVLVQSLRVCKDSFLAFGGQIRNMEKLQKKADPLFISLDIKSLADLVEGVAKAYEAEFNLKEFVLENIGYSKNKDEAMFLAAMWTYQTKISDNINLKMETLLVETGHRKTS